MRVSRCMRCLKEQPHLTTSTRHKTAQTCCSCLQNNRSPQIHANTRVIPHCALTPNGCIRCVLSPAPVEPHPRPRVKNAVMQRHPNGASTSLAVIPKWNTSTRANHHRTPAMRPYTRDYGINFDAKTPNSLVFSHKSEDLLFAYTIREPLHYANTDKLRSMAGSFPFCF